MTKNSAKIKSGIANLTHKPYEILSGKVVAGSVDTTANTVSVQPSFGSLPIKGVLLGAVSDEEDGVILIPNEGSDVIIGSVDGPGQWSLIKASELSQAIVKIGNLKLSVNANKATIQSGTALVEVGSLIKLNTTGESLFSLLNDLITAITLLTVTTSTGPSSVPINASSFTALATRLNNLLSA